MEKLPIERKENIFTKISKFFKGFSKKNKEIKNTQDTKEVQEEIDDNIYKNNIEKLREDVKNAQNVDFIIDKITEDPSLIHNLSNERLSQLAELYDNKIQEIKEKTNELDKKLNLLESID